MQTYTLNVAPNDPFIRVDDFHIVCEASASKRGTFRFVSVVVRQTCSGRVCPVNEGVSSLVQYDFECSEQNEWVGSVYDDTGDDIREDVPEADFDTELRHNCSTCGRNVIGAEPVTHCRRKFPLYSARLTDTSIGRALVAYRLYCRDGFYLPTKWHLH